MITSIEISNDMYSDVWREARAQNKTISLVIQDILARHYSEDEQDEREEEVSDSAMAGHRLSAIRQR